ncbi:hypothetical protein A2V71_04565 [Candidatus Berkelbacteria bacterium RBG_13_40_8]|uniref:ZIP family metal transporter n=1 Tax=Candidatus Berkelbacteria bacterium RBG_13_40_8 TaxID=1797467 RepID=A0A1F5DML1_9BACT|nr:MAG: hypothetical protein A2V71_04565 [Candidatus Berkelbacteria bacterium RBG_13_40_8]
MSQFLNILIYGTLAGLATILGMYLVLAKEAWARKNTIYLVSFSAGVLLSVTFMHLIPEAQELDKNALLWLLGSFVFFYIVEHGIILHACQEGECEVHPIDTIALLGIGFHSLLDGVVIGVGFGVSFSLGILATMSVLLHELPEGITTIAILLHSGYKREKAVFYSYLVAIATPFGAILSFFLVKNIASNILGILLAVAAGSFLYVAASDLIPEIHKKSKVLNIVLLIFGIILPFLVERLFK